MIQKLRRRFIITAMLAVSVLLLVLLGVINIGNIIANNRQTSYVLTNLMESEGSYTPSEEAMVQFSHTEEPAETWPQISETPSADDMLGARYFLVRFDTNGEITSADTSHIYAVGVTEAQKMARTVYDGASDSGRMDRFRFCVTQALDQQSSLVIFLDISNQIRSIRSILTISLAVCAFCWAAMLLFVMMLAQKAIEPIAENIEKQKQFVTNAGHEIKTPLSIILINTDALELHLGSNKWSKNIRAQAERLTGLMQTLLALAKMDERGIDLPKSNFSVNLLLEELLNPYYEIAADRGISLQVSFQPDVTLYANRESMMQLFSILLDNAVKYTPANGHIEASLISQGKHIAFQVQNTCSDLQDIDLAKLFDRFYRGDSSRMQKNGGYGIGLSAAQAIVRANGGTITASAGDGAILFVVRL